MIQYILPAGLSLIISLLIGSILCKVAIPTLMIDQPNERKIHESPTPKVGGIIIFGTLLIISLSFRFFINETYNYYMTLCMAFFLIGLLDDAYDWNYQKKLKSQFIFVLIFLIIIPNDISTLMFSTISINIPWLNYILLLLWIIGIINAFNFFDGINYLAGSLAIVFFTSYSMFYFNHQSVIIIVVYLILISSILGFLFFNRSPAKMFLGDSGSMFLGFLIATLPFVLPINNNVGIDVTYPVIITSILLMETVYLIFNRIRNKRSPFNPDRTHLHHVLIKLNFRNRHVVLIIFVSTILFSILAYFSKQLLFYQIVLIEILFFGVVIVMPRLLRLTKQFSLNNEIGK